MHTVSMTVNGRPETVRVPARKLLCDVLRQDLALTGTHVGCEHGACGACTIRLDGRLVRSCLMFGVQAEGAEITTIEGMADGEDDLHPVQRAFWEKHGLQCGFCTPGMVLAGAKLLEDNPDPTDEEIRGALSGHVCRCTGYVFIVDAIRHAAREMAR
ncbi:(2Fe-2S)-binding protein [Pseudonocardia acaciae]|uniref:(2Fe-2S)-binding protein n=1 Tax=Pseudonocardia acaciae TaxID=551276 RepID=UPI00048E2F2C|nr:(2Fe-2S)-binding protein [Pseudonocardia acaciae]